MIVGGYSLHLYCDHEYADPEEQYKHMGLSEYPGPGRAEFTGETGGEARQAARKRGWVLDLKNGKAFCPDCVKAGRHSEKGHPE